ncbi:protein DDI1 homolog 1-like [Oratosquilla oratoria]|uniref:protein DDI1 homolog 1-like n=1 Tax=Oratosquilla oratoria TaxID=337810 RepID=UPI003F75A39C
MDHFKIVIKVVDRNLSFQQTLDSSATVGDLERKAHQYLTRDSVKKIFVRHELSIGTVTSLDLSFRGERLKNSEKPLSSYEIQNGDIVEAEATWIEYGIQSLLYVECQINGFDVPAFVDSGCSISTLSTRLARRLGLLDVVDRDFAFEVDGPNGDEVIGCIHDAEVRLGGTLYSVNFDVMDSSTDLWIGLDMMIREGMCINVPKGTLEISSTKTQVPLLTLNEARRRVIRNRIKAARSLRREEKRFGRRGRQEVETSLKIERSVKN